VAGPGQRDVLVSVHQPNFLPWLRLLDKILASDIYVAYDTVQYTKSEYHARQRVRTYTGPAWLSLPLLSVRGQRQQLREVRLDPGQPFRPRHLKTLRAGYAKAPFFAEVYEVVEDVYARNQSWLVDLNVDLIEAICRYLGSPVRIVRASALPHHGDNTDRLVELVRQVGGTVHLTSTYGTQRRYVDWPRVQAAGIAVRAQAFEHPTYDQPWPGFVPDLAALDMLFCRGRATAEVLAACRRFHEVGPLAGEPAAEAPAEGQPPAGVPAAGEPAAGVDAGQVRRCRGCS
jgi:hypothetical protein